MNEPPRPDRRTPLLLGAAVASAFLLPLPAALALAAGAVAWRVVWPRLQRRRATRVHNADADAATAGAVVIGTARSGNRVSISDRALTAHTLVLGASGAGKSTTLLRLLGERIDRGAPVVAIDLKGSPAFAAELRAATTAAGRGLQVWTPDGSASWNPLAHGNATELKDKLIATERFSEPHYQRAAERYLQLAIQTLQAEPAGGPVTLQRVVEMLEPKRLAAAARGLPEARGQHVRAYVSNLTADQVSAVRGLGTRLAILTESHTGAFLAPAATGDGDAAGRRGAEVDLHRALGGGAAEGAGAHPRGAPDVVLFSLNSSRYGQLAAQLGTLAVQDLVAATGARLERPPGGPPALIAIDEFSALGADNVLALLARGREAGVGVVLATQELADLDRAARGLRDQVLGNTATKIAHRQDVPESAQTVARLAGTVERWERTYQERPGRLPGTRSARGTTATLKERYAIPPETIRALPTGQAVVISKVPQASAELTRIEPPGPAAQPTRESQSTHSPRDGTTEAGKPGQPRRNPTRRGAEAQPTPPGVTR